MIIIKRVYDKSETKDGFRILVDRLWPRGISKEKGKIDLWMKEIAPSNELRTSFHHGKMDWSEFKNRYLKELKEKQELLNELKNLKKKHGTVTLLYGSKDTEHNQAVILTEVLGT